MTGVTTTQSAQKKHGALVSELAARLETLPQFAEIVLCDREEAASFPAKGRKVIALTLGDRTSVNVRGRDQVAIAYKQGGETSAVAAALAAAQIISSSPVCADPRMIALLTLAERVAQSTVPVLVEGPTGTGKEVLAQFIHNASDRRDGAFVAVNCAAMPEAMLEAMLFGHRKGAFTGASEANEGFFRAADGGTLLLDEIGELPLGLQAKLLRALQEGEVVPIGATKPISIDVRVIACTNRDLPQDVADGKFRADLYYRLNVFPLHIPALRERHQDLTPLAFAMVLRHTLPGGDVPWVSSEALAKLGEHSWPGNIRELENVIRRALLLAGSEPEILAEHIVFDGAVRAVSQGSVMESASVAAAPTSLNRPTTHTRPANLAAIAKQSETKAILDTLEQCGGKRVEAAKRLGISERTLRYRLASMREDGMDVAGHVALGAAR